MWHRRSKLAWTGAAMAALVLIMSGCGSTPAPGPGAWQVVWNTSAHHGLRGVPGAARAYARHLLARLALPSGARLVTWPARRSLQLRPELPDEIGDSVSVRALYQVAAPMSVVAGRLRADVPPGMRPAGAGRTSQGSAVLAESVSYLPRRLPSGIAEAELGTALVRGAAIACSRSRLS